MPKRLTALDGSLKSRLPGAPVLLLLGGFRLAEEMRIGSVTVPLGALQKKSKRPQATKSPFGKNSD